MIRLLKREEKSLLRGLWDQEFSFDDGGFTSFFFDNYFDDCLHYVLDEDGIKSLASICYHQVFFRGEYVKVAMILGVITLKEFRHQGKMDILLNYLLNEVLNNDPFVMIQAYDVDLYKHLGFRVEYYRYHYFYNEKEADDLMELDSLDLLNIYHKYCSDKEGFYQRSDSDMKMRMRAVKKMNGVFYGNKGAYCEFYPESRTVECLIFTEKDQAISLLSALAYKYGTIEVYDQDDLLDRGERLPYTQIRMKDDDYFVFKKTFMHEYI